MKDRPKSKSVDPKYGRMLKDQETAERLGWAKNTLQQRRADGQPVPDYVKYSLRRCLTPESAVTKFIEKYYISANET